LPLGKLCWGTVRRERSRRWDRRGAWPSLFSHRKA